ncbi:MAG: sugar transferase related protein [uncultured bacterium]|uniref:Glycosyltransferase 2-like domain-containing protein n=1 Tax=Candidatus Woesebacteria bacterium GW2011_GWA1_40_43 TaxID=1618553 RepID=A0A0G0SID7_9BACT|nr:MAG: sugar transferase related protein [uncultured bacterium]KKR52871.1 MAG: hypothetical protein UT88_C0018G0005 [Candidatus Woesebacteria bacterium GW2011_GWD2_40_19]KKR58374.1 MAG: hypothetical protein UT96_C0006G0005 [Candidatus Woesebacteria bacterium GW2011_GWC2_40_30]KKR64598.1 MAG: hypothetical protein UU02_C0006G0005 [Candidatus Woesebacteria bacterium GW2011_GWA1_40_43]HAU65404.1 hypothetical protein [Candidatus Woesebacteria bacterium]
MNISICITVFNEEGTISALLDSLVNQTKKPDEIVIVDGGSTDRTVEIINHYQKRFGDIKLLKEKCTRAKGRNLSVELARNEIIAITDAGCVADKNWLKNLVGPFANGGIDVSAGFYRMTGSNPFRRAMSVFLGTAPRNFNMTFLPSTRSVAFTRKIWVDIGGFPEGMKEAAEDTAFNYKLVNFGAKISRVKSAIVEWGMPKTLKDFFWKTFAYAKGDVKLKIWIFPEKGIMSHNIKVLSVFFRYLIGILLLVFSFRTPLFFAVFAICLFAYLFWSFRKVFLEFGDWKVSLWGPILQITSDMAVIGGFTSGILSR